MKFVSRIEIHRFRSISDASLIAEDLTIFSGTNNSGKSNVLRALNLFFNGESSFGNPYNFEKDYNIAYTGQAGGQRIIKITVHFPGQGNGALEKPFSISRTFDTLGNSSYSYHSSDGFTQSKLDKDDGNIKRQYTRFLNKFVYFYVPAVRDREFVQSLLLNFEQLIDRDMGGDFDKSIQELSAILSKKSAEISKDFEAFIQLPTEAALSSKKSDILGAVEVNVDSGIDVLRKIRGKTKPERVKVNIFSSGDGILMSYLAYFIAHISKKLQDKKFIWGFEEPENSLEYSKVQKLAEDFSERFVNYAQIFITTHSPAFINLKDKKANAFYRVYIKPGDTKRSTEIRTLDNLEILQTSLFKTAPFSSEYMAIEKELNLVEYALEVEKVLDKLISEKQDYIRKSDKFESDNKRFLESKPEKIFICEDEDVAVIKFWESMFAIYGLTGVKIVSSQGSSNPFVENGIVYQSKLDAAYKPRVFREVDRDGLTEDQIESIRSKFFKKYEQSFTYAYEPLPVNEIENFAVITNGEFDDTFWMTYGQDVIKAFEKTADAITRRFHKDFNYEEDAGFMRSGTNMPVIQVMRDQASADWKRLMPGKTMVSKLDNFRALEYLVLQEKSSQSPELKRYMQKVVDFFR